MRSSLPVTLSVNADKAMFWLSCLRYHNCAALFLFDANVYSCFVLNVSMLVYVIIEIDDKLANQRTAQC